MNLYKRTIVTIFILFMMMPGYSQTQIRLLCKGELRTTIDLKTDTTQLMLDVTVNTQSQTMKIPGYWGCLGSMGNRERVCPEEVPISIKDDEFFSYTGSDGDEYKGSTFLKINRYSGLLTISGLAQAKQNSNARWIVMMTDAKLPCINIDKPAF